MISSCCPWQMCIQVAPLTGSTRNQVERGVDFAVQPESEATGEATQSYVGGQTQQPVEMLVEELFVEPLQ